LLLEDETGTASKDALSLASMLMLSQNIPFLNELEDGTGFSDAVHSLLDSALNSAIGQGFNLPYKPGQDERISELFIDDMWSGLEEFKSANQSGTAVTDLFAYLTE
jgi:hypothetical protein